jgi:ubiquinol-cytochrome c reductase iron-sulfur subunit
VRRLGRWLIALAAALWVPSRRSADHGRIVPPGSPNRRAENLTVTLLLAAALFAIAFVVVYAIDDLGNRTQLFGVTLGLAFGCVAAALIVLGKRLVVSEELEADYPPPEHPEDQERLVQLVEESGGGITPKRLMLVGGGAAGTALGAAALAPALSLGPVLDTSGLRETPWRRGRRLVDSEGRPLRAEAISTDTFYSAYPEGAKKDKIGSPLVVVRLDPDRLDLPPERSEWAPEGILAFSKICTHAGCAVSEYRTPLFEPTAPSPALVCPCHYSTFDPATGGDVVFGPAGRPLPQLPLVIDARGELRAGGGYSGPVGPGWSGVRRRGT